MSPQQAVSYLAASLDADRWDPEQIGRLGEECAMEFRLLRRLMQLSDEGPEGRKRGLRKVCLDFGLRVPRQVAAEPREQVDMFDRA